MLITFGGHKYAAGVSIQIDRVPEFRKAINAVANEMIDTDMLVPELHVDAMVDMNELTPKLFAIIRQLAPFGPDNHRPLFYSKDVQVTGYPRTVGKATEHLKTNLRSKYRLYLQPEELRSISQNNIPLTVGGSAIDTIGFGLGKRIDELTDKTGRLRDDIEAVYALDENEYNGKTTPQLVLKDYR